MSPTLKRFLGDGVGLTWSKIIPSYSLLSFEAVYKFISFNFRVRVENREKEKVVRKHVSFGKVVIGVCKLPFGSF